MADTRKEAPEARNYRSGGSATQEWNAALLTATAVAAYSPRRASDGSGPNPMTVDELKATQAALIALAPADEVEAMLASQVIASHAGCLEALRRAAHPAGDDVATMWGRAAELSRTMLDNLAELERRQAARREQTAPKAEAPTSSAEPSPIAPPPPPPEMMDTTSDLDREQFIQKHLARAKRANPDVPLTNEELAHYGYRSRGPLNADQDTSAPEGEEPGKGKVQPDGRLGSLPVEV